MKILFSLLALLIFNKDCEEHKSTEMSVSAMNSEKTMTAIERVSSVSYEATTRGFYEKIWVTKDRITVTNDRNQVEKTEFPISEKDWNELMTLLMEVNIEALPELEAPTSKRNSDGAAFASLIVTQGDLETVSNSFDHGNPPKEIEAVVNKVLSMKKMYDKN